MAERAKAKKKAASKKRAVPKGATGSRGKVAKTAKAASGRGDNSGDHAVPDEVYQRHLRAIERTASAMDKAKEAYDQTRGEHRAAYKVAKDDGCDIEAIKLARKLDETDHGIVVVTYSNTGRILQLMRSPLAIQMDLFADMAPVVKKMEDEGVDQALAGAHAFSNEEPIDNNPHIPGTMKFGQWEAGYLRAQNEAGGGTEH
jgi:hypothetical protein